MYLLRFSYKNFIHILSASAATKFLTSVLLLQEYLFNNYRTMVISFSPPFSPFLLFLFYLPLRVFFLKKDSFTGGREELNQNIERLKNDKDREVRFFSVSPPKL